MTGARSRTRSSSRGLRRRAATMVAVGSACALVVSSCATGTDRTGVGGDEAAGYPITIDNCGYQQVFTKKPERVLILQGSSVGEATTMVELGLQGSVIANAQHYGVSDIPGMAAKVDALPRGGLTLNAAMDVPAEQVLSRKPDLVISTWSGGFDPKYGFAGRDKLAQAGINTLVNPTNCAYGKVGNVSDQEKQAHSGASVDSSLQYLALIGKIFGVAEHAEMVADGIRARIEAVADRVQDLPKKKILVVFPSMSAMNANGLPAVMSGGIYDSVVQAAGGEPSLANGGPELTASLSAERLAAADVDVLVLGTWQSGEDLDAEARKLFAAYPQWSASKTKTYATVSDGVYLGPANAAAIEKIAGVAHPNAG